MFRSPAQIFAYAAHQAVGQKRKYTGEPYHTHPEAVRQLLERYVPHATQAMLDAASLHDVVEDTQVSFQDIYTIFGSEVARLVQGLTEDSYPDTMNRFSRKQAECVRLSETCKDTKTIKLADLIDNSKSIGEYAGGFAAVYMKEKRNLLDSALKEGDHTLWVMADKIVKDYFESY